MILRRKLFTKYDDTDVLKGMKDSDILAEKKRKTGFGNVIGSAAGGALALGAAGAIGGTALGVSRLRSAPIAPAGVMNKAKFVGHTAGKTAGMAALGGALIGGGIAAIKRAKKAKENKFYNDRLEYAKRQALRRERKDWKNNMTQRESYTY